MAGESAREIARKSRDKATRLAQVADAYDRGAAGEEETARALDLLPPDGWRVVHDVRWPGRRFANIDHIAVGPTGVYVIDSKAWSGTVSIRGGVLRQGGNRRDSAVTNAEVAARSVGELVPQLDRAAVKPVLCFVGQHDLAKSVGDVLVCTPDDIVERLSTRPVVLDDGAVRRVAAQLLESLPSRDVAKPVRTRTRARNQSRSSGPHVVSALVAIAAIVFGFWALSGHANALARMIQGIATHVPSTSPDEVGSGLGTARNVPAGTNRPPLRVTADHAGTAHRLGSVPYLYDGNRLFGVRLTIKNTGKRAWASQPGSSETVMDSLGVPHPGGSAIRIREGKVLPDPIRIPPGGVARGYVVFQVPQAQPITSFSFTVGPGRPHTTTWWIDRQ